MKRTKNMIAAACVTVAALTGTSQAQAGIPVIDGANLAQAMQQVMAWAEQYKQMAEQIDQYAKQIEQARKTYDSISGIRNMGDLANTLTDQGLRQYLPQEYQALLSNGVGQWREIRDANRRFDLAMSNLSRSNSASQAFHQMANMAAINRAASEQAYNRASQRFTVIQQLMNKVNQAPDQKDILDLQGRIQAEHAMLQNEGNKLQALTQLAMAQKDMQAQQNAEISMEFTRKKGLPAGW